MAPSCCLKYKKMNARDIAGMMRHDARRVGHRHVDLDRSHLNRTLVGQGSDILGAIKAREAATGAVIRSNVDEPYVYGLATTSPEYFRDEGQGPGEWNPEKLEAWTEATLKYLKRQFGENLVWASIDLDEATPHIDFTVVPIVEQRRKGGKTVQAVSPRTLFWSNSYGKEKGFAAYQTTYAEALAHLGIVRGEPGSDAEYKPVKDMNELKRRENELRSERSHLDLKHLVVKSEANDAKARAAADRLVGSEVIDGEGDRTAPVLVFDQTVTDDRQDEIMSFDKRILQYVWEKARAWSEAILAQYARGIAQAQAERDNETRRNAERALAKEQERRVTATRRSINRSAREL